MRLHAVVVSISVMIASSAHAQDSHEHSNAVVGDGKSYVAQVVIGDLAAVAIIPITVVPTWSSDPWIWSIPLSGAPLTLTGPLIHAVHGRWVPAVASFLGWASVVATSWFAGAELSLALAPHSNCIGLGIDRVEPPCTSTPSNYNATDAAIGIGVGFGIVGTILMTALDAWMARPIKHRHASTISFAPNAWVSGDGARGGVSGSF
jgi:hypothetical protein